MDILYVVGVYLCLLFGCFLAMKVLPHGQQSTTGSVDKKITTVLACAQILGTIALIFGLTIMDTDLTPVVGFLWLGLIVLGLFPTLAVAFSPVRQFHFVAIFLATLGGLLLMTTETALTPVIPLTPVGYILFALLWTVATYIFVLTDRVLFFSMIFSVSILLLVFLMTVFGLIQPMVNALVMTLVVAQMGVNLFLRTKGMVHLGALASVFVGFMMAGVCMYMARIGYVRGTFVVYAYPATEILVSAVVSLYTTHKLSLQAPYYAEQALQMAQQPSKVLSYLYKVTFFFSTVAVLLNIASTHYFGLLLGVIAFMVFGFCSRLKKWNTPTPKIRGMIKDMVSDFKNSTSDVSELTSQIKETFFGSSSHTKTVSKTKTSVKESDSKVSSETEKASLTKKSKATKTARKKK